MFRQPLRAVLATACLATACGVVGVLRAQPVVEVPDGFVARPEAEFDPRAPFDLQVGGLALLPDGRAVVYEAGEIRVLGTAERTVLATFRPAVFGSFVVPSPDGRHVYFGESSEQQIWRVPLAPDPVDPPVVVDRLAFGFDLDFAPEAAGEELAGRGFISGFGSTGENSIWLLDDDPSEPNDEIVAAVSPFSGPLAFDPNGNLYYMTSGIAADDTGLPANRLIRYTPELLASAVGDGALDASAGEVIVTGHDGFFDLVWLDGRLWGTNLGFGVSPAGVEVVDVVDGLATPFAATIVEGAIASPTWIAPWRGSGTFQAGEGARGGRLLMAWSDFSTVNRVERIEPELWFVRGEVNGDGDVDLSDAVAALDWLFAGGEEPEIRETADVNDDGVVNVADPVYLLDFLFRGGPAVPAPFPERGPEP